MERKLQGATDLRNALLVRARNVRDDGDAETSDLCDWAARCNTTICRRFGRSCGEAARMITVFLRWFSGIVEERHAFQRKMKARRNRPE